MATLNVATLNEVEMLMSWSRQLGQVAGAVIEAKNGLDHGVGQPLAVGLPHACPHVLLGDRGP
jgi:hypothetical protein